MKRLIVLLLFGIAISGCSDPTRVITNRPKTAEQQQKQREQRRREDKAATEALKSFRVSDQTRKKANAESQQQTTQESAKGAKTKSAEQGK